MRSGRNLALRQMPCYAGLSELTVEVIVSQGPAGSILATEVDACRAHANDGHRILLYYAAKDRGLPIMSGQPDQNDAKSVVWAQHTPRGCLRLLKRLTLVPRFVCRRSWSHVDTEVMPNRKLVYCIGAAVLAMVSSSSFLVVVCRFASNLFRYCQRSFCLPFGDVQIWPTQGLRMKSAMSSVRAGSTAGNDAYHEYGRFRPFGSGEAVSGVLGQSSLPIAVTTPVPRLCQPFGAVGSPCHVRGHRFQVAARQWRVV